MEWELLSRVISIPALETNPVVLLEICITAADSFFPPPPLNVCPTKSDTLKVDESSKTKNIIYPGPQFQLSKRKIKLWQVEADHNILMLKTVSCLSTWKLMFLSEDGCFWFWAAKTCLLLTFSDVGSPSAIFKCSNFSFSPIYVISALNCKYRYYIQALPWTSPFAILYLNMSRI